VHLRVRPSALTQDVSTNAVSSAALNNGFLEVAVLDSIPVAAAGYYSMIGDLLLEFDITFSNRFMNYAFNDVNPSRLTLWWSFIGGYAGKDPAQGFAIALNGGAAPASGQMAGGLATPPATSGYKGVARCRGFTVLNSIHANMQFFTEADVTPRNFEKGQCFNVTILNTGSGGINWTDSSTALLLTTCDTDEEAYDAPGPGDMGIAFQNPNTSGTGQLEFDIDWEPLPVMGN